MWERYADQGGIRYSLNTAHPLVVALKGSLDEAATKQLSLLLDAVPASLPIEMIYSDYATSPRQISRPTFTEDEIRDRLKALKTALFGDDVVDAAGFREVVRSTRLFDRHMEAAERFIAEELT